MRYRLALDLGSTSLGWAMLDLRQDNTPKAIVKTGVRIFSDGRNPKNGSSLAVTRRAARGMRRRRDRLLIRKRRILKQLIAHGFFPTDAQERKALETLNPYALRAKGLDEALTPQEFGRALFHINQRRGFKSNRKTDKKDNDSGALKQAISGLRAQLASTGCRTVGEWFWKARMQTRPEGVKGQGVRARHRETPFTTEEGKKKIDKSYDLYIDRAMVEQEFDALWAAQAHFNPAQFNEAARSELKDTLLFQRRLRPVKPGRCTLLPDEPRAPLALPSTQRFRIYQEVNHLRLLNDQLEQIPLTLAQRDVIAAALETATQLSFDKMRKLLKLGGGVHFNLEDEKRAALKGNATTVSLSKTELFGPMWQGLSADLQDEVVWQLINEESEVALIAWLVQHTGVDLDRAEAIANAGLPEGYGSLSRPALARIVPALRDPDENGLPRSYDKAVQAAGFSHHSDLDFDFPFEDDEVEQVGERVVPSTGEIRPLRVFKQLPYYGRALRRYVAFAKDNPRNEEEQFGKIANPTVHIGLNQVRVVVNALIRRYGPFSMTLDDSLNNRTVAMRQANRVKRNRTPWAARADFEAQGWSYDGILLRTEHMPRAKRKRFAPDGYEQWLGDDKDFLARALNDTRYLARVATEYLRLVCPGSGTRVIPGQMTAMLRAKFGLNDILGLDGEKNRNDHRHHAVDACVIGVTDQGMMQRFAQANADTRDKGLTRLVDEMPLPWATYREHVQRAVNHIWVSHRPDHGFEGAMMEETSYGIGRDGSIRQRRKADGSGGREITNLIRIAEPTQPARHGVDADGRPLPYKGYVGGSNYCIEITVNDKGKWEGEVISTFQAYGIAREGGLAQLRHSSVGQNGRPLAMRLVIGDSVRLEIDDKEETMQVVTISRNGQVFMAALNEANVDARNRDKQDAFSYLSKMAGSFQKAKGRRITLSPIGELRDPGFRE